jgi:hypothetical protein
MMSFTRRQFGLLAASMPVVAAEPGFRPLFDGKTLIGWDGDPRLWSVKNGVLVGSTEGVELPRNTFLISKESFQDFELRLEIKLRNHNSGVQFRSERIPDTEWGVRGLQADAAEGNWWGSIYDEGGKRGVIVNGWKGKAETVVKATDWNDYRIWAKGGDIRLTLNGLVTAELHGEEPKSGIFGLQLHRGPAMVAEFRNIRIQTL